MAFPFAHQLKGLDLEPSKDSRSQSALDLRQHAAITQSKHSTLESIPNSDETAFPNWIACFARGLPQNQFGEVDPHAYMALLSAVQSGEHTAFERIPKGAGRKPSNPQASFAFHLEGADSHQFFLPPALP